MSRRRLLYLITEDWYFWSHRRTLAEAARDAGYEVVLATRVQELGDAIRDLGIEPIPIRLRRSGRNPVEELLAIRELAAIYRRVQPDVVHHVGVKPMLYGSWAARLSGVKAIVNAQPGLGYVFTAEGVRAGLLRAAVSVAYRSAWAGKRTRVIFQNRDNLEFFVKRGMVSADRAVLIPGCGVELERYSPRPEPQGEPVVMMAGRMLWDKGVAEIVQAANILKDRDVPCRIVLVGRPDPDNPKAVPESYLMRESAAGTIEWWGYRTDMPATLAEANVVVLPSYAEGMPMSLVEAAAAGRAIVTTDVPGCRDVVTDGENGLLVPPRDGASLASAVERLLGDPTLRATMGARGRARAERDFSSAAIARQTLDVYESITTPSSQ